jgi:hypothetical protein
MSESEHIFKGEAVDLKKILSSFHRVSLDSERKASVGDTEISVSTTETKRKVETSSEWSTSWRSASRAIAFVFKHREQELVEYGDYIECLFAAKRSSSHGQVICSTGESEMKLEVAKPCFSPITSTLPHFTLQPCKMTGSNTIDPGEGGAENRRHRCVPLLQ